MKIDIIYNEDCIKTINDRIENKSIDVVLTSPPYNIIRPNSTDRGYDLYKDGMTNDQYSQWCCNIINSLDDKIKDNGCILWNMSYGSENTECMIITIHDILKKTNFTLADIIIWKKKSATPNNVSKNKLTRICEHIFVLCRRSEFDTFFSNKNKLKTRESGQAIYENIFNFIESPNNDGSNILNKATFSSNMVRKLLNIYATNGSLIYDPFMGTGTTAIGAIRNKCHYIGSELSEKQCNYATNRIKMENLQKKLF